jgi:PHD/YefM family antitoxin component YafN of YafNO toxin-antitoxin module
VFRDDRDRQEYLDRLIRCRERFGLRVLAFCLMGNHLHLAVEGGGDRCHPLRYHGEMKTLTIRDFRTRPRQAQKALADEGEALLTSNGRPVALMLRVDSDSLDQTMETVRRARALQAVRKMRADAKARGLDRLSSKQIDAIIARSRKARRRRA